MLHRATSHNTQDQDEISTSSAGIERPLGRPSMPSLRGRTSPLKFFASSSAPKAKDRRDSHQEWEKDYLQDLRSNRPVRPSGARPPPSRISDLSESTQKTPLRTSSAMSFRPSLPLRQTSPTRLQDPDRCSSALSHRRETSHDSSTALTEVEQGHPLSYLDSPAATGQSMAQARPDVVRARDTSSMTQTSSGIYRERGERLVEKEEARMLREALETVDLKCSAAQAEASELVRTHRNAGAPRKDLDAPYLHKQRLWSTSHARSQSDVPVPTVPGPTDSHTTLKRSISEDSSIEHHSNDRKQSLGSLAADTQKYAAQAQPRTVEFRQEGTVSETAERNVDHSGKGLSQLTNGHALWDSPHKQAYMNLSFSLPQVKSHGRRRSSGSKTRTLSGSLFRNPDDKIYEEPEEVKQVPIPSKSSQMAESAPLRSTTQNPVTKLQATGQRYPRSMADPVESKSKYSRTEIHRNPPSQSRNPSYLQNEGPPVPADQTIDVNLQSTGNVTRDGVEIRSDDIRAATSMRLRDRSPKLPSPTVVSNAKGRPIVSFDKDWAPSRTDLKLQEPSQPQSSIQGARCLTSSPTACPKPPLLEFTVSAPAIPTINVPEPPSIHIDEVPPVPSISVSAIPSISISAEEPSCSSEGEKTKSSRPLPNPGRKATTKPLGRPLPHHSSTAPVHSSVPHWSPAQRRTTAQCAGCALPISGRVVRASSQGFHPECFTCFHCSELLECVAFYPEPENYRNDRIARIGARAEGIEVPDEPGKTWEDDGDESLRFYCHLDFHEKFSPRCRSCKTPIEGEVVVACGGEWHVGHFFCAQCGDPFDQKTPFVEKDGYAWCVGCHTNRFSGKCRGCKKPVVDLVVRALGGEWHEGCFCCKVSMAPSLSLNANKAIAKEC
ncbi:MAG: hypothetical protein Q9184_002591 [Pyrenodesmia sp. 2 TL-2023]